jgi:hypothetical protein
MGNDILVQAKGKGTITVHTEMCLRFMRDKLLVPDLKHNLLSMRQLVQNGYVIYFKKNGCKIINRHGQVLSNIGIEDNKNFALQMKYKMSEHNVKDFMMRIG